MGSENLTPIGFLLCAVELHVRNNVKNKSYSLVKSYKHKIGGRWLVIQQILE